MRTIQTGAWSVGPKAPRKQLAKVNYKHERYDQVFSPRKRSSSHTDLRPAKKLRFSVSSRPVKVVVGTTATAVEYTFHEDLLAKHSDFAAAAMNGKWRESDEGTIYLADDDPALFEVFANFVYTGKIYYDTAEDKDDVDNDDESSEHEDRVEEEEVGLEDDKVWSFLGRCYPLGDKLLSHSFKSAIVDVMAKKVFSDEDNVPRGLYLLAYNHTVGDNGYKRLIVDIACGAWEEDDFRNVDSVDFLRDVAIQWRRCKGHPADRDELCMMGCEYHDHGEEEVCYLDMF